MSLSGEQLSIEMIEPEWPNIPTCIPHILVKYVKWHELWLENLKEIAER